MTVGQPSSKPKQRALMSNSAESSDDDEVISEDRLQKPDPKLNSSKPRNRWLDITRREMDAQGRRFDSL